jgi:peptidoglycan/xylan/chitin deacetylase (PgdA/CDA1 family)
MNWKQKSANIARDALYGLGLLGLYHRLRNRHTLTVLMFHRVLPADSLAYRRAEREFTFTTEGFARCLDFVQKHYNPISLDQLEAATAGNSALPPRAVLITFDDGWRDTLLYAYPELRKRSLPAVLFLATEVLELTSNRWWQDALVEVMGDPQKVAGLARELGMGESSPDFHDLTVVVAAMQNSDRMKLLGKLVDCEGYERQMLTIEDLAIIDRKTMAMAAHGHSHSPMNKNKYRVDDLKKSRELIASIGGNPRAMSFPHGNWSPDTEADTRTIGYQLIFSSDAKLNHSPFVKKAPVICRIHVPENQWTTIDEVISPSRLGTFLFVRQIAG